MISLGRRDHGVSARVLVGQAQDGMDTLRRDTNQVPCQDKHISIRRLKCRQDSAHGPQARIRIGKFAVESLAHPTIARPDRHHSLPKHRAQRVHGSVDKSAIVANLLLELVAPKSSALASD